MALTNLEVLRGLQSSFFVKQFYQMVVSAPFTDPTGGKIVIRGCDPLSNFSEIAYTISAFKAVMTPQITTCSL